MNDTLQSLPGKWRALAATKERRISPQNIVDLADELEAALAARVESVSGREAVGWLANDGTGRVIDAKAKRAGERASATGSATSVYSIPLFAHPPAADVVAYRHSWPGGKDIVTTSAKPPGGFDGWAATTQRLIVHPDDIRTVTQEGLE